MAQYDESDRPYDSVNLFKSLVMAGLQNKAPEINYDPFDYDDTDSLENELNDFYNLAEKGTFYEAWKIFDQCFPKESWKSKSPSAKRGFISNLLEALEVAGPTPQATITSYHSPAQCLLYLMQGAFFECSSTAEQLEQIQITGELVYDCGGLPVLMNAFVVALSLVQKMTKVAAQEEWYDHVILYLSLLYYLIITNSKNSSFAHDLAHSKSRGKPLIILLFEYLSIFADKNYEFFPLKKLLMVIWRCLLASLGGSELQRKMMDVARKKAGLPPIRKEIYTKASEEDVEKYEVEIASKFYGMNPFFNESSLGDEDPLLATLPKPIREGYITLKKNLYTPLSKQQLKTFEEEYTQRAALGQVRPESADKATPDEDVDDLEAHSKIWSEDEMLLQRIAHMNYIYKYLHHDFARYLIIFLKVLLAAVPSVKKYTGTINLGAELKTSHKSKTESKSVYVETMQGNFESLRHREIIAKVISAILLLLLKHTKISHFLQHEYISQVLVDANCILLILKFLNQDMAAYCTQMNEITDGKFLVQCMKKSPHAKLAEDPGEIPKGHVCWRNTFAVVNLLRILQKLTKSKVSRISVLIQYKAPGILKRVVKLPHGNLSYYALKLLKSQLPSLGKKWQNGNMRIVSSIMFELRSRSSEANLLSNISEEEDDNFIEETDYSSFIEAYNQIYCNDPNPLPNKISDDLDSDLSKVELERDFENNYEQWLDEQVFDEETYSPLSPERSPSPTFGD